LTAFCCGLAALSGCHLLNLYPTPPEKTDVAKKDTARSAAPPEAVGLPCKYQNRVSQYVFVSDFEIKADLPLFKELSDMRDLVHKTLQLPSSNNVVQVYLFEDADRYERFMKSKYPDLPKRRAFFIAQPRIGGEELLVYTYWGNGDRIQQDLRHELTHALLHSVLKDVPLWLDEGIAEYFEIAPSKNTINAEHVKQLRQSPNGQPKFDLARLEDLKEVEQMNPAEYREAWAWVHLMLHTNPEARKVLIAYLKDLRSTKSPGSLRTRLATIFPTPETALERHLTMIDQYRRPALAEK